MRRHRLISGRSIPSIETTASHIDFAARPDVAADFGSDAIDNSQDPAERSDLVSRRSIRGANSRLTFAEAASRIVEHGEGLASERIPLSQLKVEGKSVNANGREFRLGPEGYHRLCDRFGAPADYLQKLSPELRGGVLNYHLHGTGRNRGKLTDANSRIFHRDGVFIDLGRSDLHTLSGADVLQAVRDGCGADAAAFEVHHLEMRDEAFRLDIVSPSVAIEVRPGDVIEAGLSVEHYYTGLRATTVMASIVRLLCANGLVQRECVGVRRTARTRRLDTGQQNAENLQIEQIRHMVADTRQRLDAKLVAIKKLASERADQAQLEQFLHQARMHSRGLMDGLQNAWAAEGDERTAFGLLNALTRLATHDAGLSARQRAALARLAGIYANRNVHLCPHCFSMLASPAPN
jgi:hypothetical protein